MVINLSYHRKESAATASLDLGEGMGIAIPDGLDAALSSLANTLVEMVEEPPEEDRDILSWGKN